MQTDDGRPRRAAPGGALPVAVLGPSARLAVSAFRHWIAGLRYEDARVCALAWNELAAALGAQTGREALCALDHLVHAIAFHGRRPFRYHPPCCPFAGADELRLIALIAACRERDQEAVRTRAECLVTPNGLDDMLEAADSLARALAALDGTAAG